MAEAYRLEDDEIEIPVIEIAAGWTVDELLTLDDIDDAHAYLIGATAAIEAKIEAAEERGTNTGLAYRRLRTALKWKRAALQVVQTKRGKLNRQARIAESETQNQRLLKTISAMFPEQFQLALAALQTAETATKKI